MKYVYFFGDGKTEGSSSDRKLLGGKGANLAEMTSLGIPVPPGFTISTDACLFFIKHGKVPADLKKEIDFNLTKIEKNISKSFGDIKNPLLVSVRSGARESMPGMMETVLNIGITSKTIPGLIKKSNNERFVYDSYRRLISMYADVVMEKGMDIEPIEGESIREKLEYNLNFLKKREGIHLDCELSVKHLKELCNIFKTTIKKNLNREFPDNHYVQLYEAINAVFKSWNGKRAIQYRNIENIPHNWGTAVNIQSMVFGNMGINSATGVAFTRNPANGKNYFYGEWLPNAQGEDVVAGIRTPNPLNELNRNYEDKKFPSLENYMPLIYKKLLDIRKQLEIHFLDMQDIEFTIEDEKLWILQTRVGKRNGNAALRIAIDMLEEGLIDEKIALLRVNQDHLNEIMHPTLDPIIEKNTKELATGLPAGPGGASGQIVFTANDAEKWQKDGKKVILVREETSPEDVHGMYASEAILTTRGGMTSHAALVARGWGKCCIVGCTELNILSIEKSLSVNGTTLKEGDWITLNGSSGKVYNGKMQLQSVNLNENPYFSKLMKLSNKYRKIGIRTNVESTKDALQARNFGAEGIGLCRTEHMFFDAERISYMREMILAKNVSERRKAIMKLLPYQQNDFYQILKTMAPYPVTIRLLDPPLHEFLPQKKEQIDQLSKTIGISFDELNKRVVHLKESNPMLGHRGCRLGVSYSEITEMQSRAIFLACAELSKENIHPFAEVMVPLISTVGEFIHQKNIIKSVAKTIKEETNSTFDFSIGTMIELPRACVIADSIAEHADFFSFGTNDLTQTTYGFSRDDIGNFLSHYLENNIISHDPFQSIDQEGVGQLVKMGLEKGRSVNSKIKVGICGEHGGDPKSISFFHKIGLDYVSCSPFRIPIAHLSAAQLEIIKDTSLENHQ